jgi:hypothetical protein
MGMAVFLIVFVPILLVLSLYITHRVSYSTGYKTGQEDEQGRFHEIYTLLEDKKDGYDILAKVREILLPLVRADENVCGDMLPCTVTHPSCIECLAKQVESQYKSLEQRLQYKHERIHGLVMHQFEEQKAPYMDLDD